MGSRPNHEDMALMIDTSYIDLSELHVPMAVMFSKDTSAALTFPKLLRVLLPGVADGLL